MVFAVAGAVSALLAVRWFGWPPPVVLAAAVGRITLVDLLFARFGGRRLRAGFQNAAVDVALWGAAIAVLARWS